MQNAQTLAATDADASSSAALATEDPLKQQAKELKASCDASRAARAQETREWAAAWQATLDRTNKHAAAIKKVCAVNSLEGTHVEAERDSHGKIARLRPTGRVDDVTCRGALPLGVAREDARLYLYAHDPGFAKRLAFADTSRWADDTKCADLDQAAGLDTQVTYATALGATAKSAKKP